MAKLAVQLRDKFFGLVGHITSCGRAGAAHKDAAAGAIEPKSQHVEIRSRGGKPPTKDGSISHQNGAEI
ncbi:hypothetical protein ACP70R_002987 [Stipagrostis hirtigluma subsp. patula]